MEIKFLAVIPDVPGKDMRYPTRRLAEREVGNARKAGLRAEVREIMIRSPR